MGNKKNGNLGTDKKKILAYPSGKVHLNKVMAKLIVFIQLVLNAFCHKKSTFS